MVTTGMTPAGALAAQVLRVTIVGHCPLTAATKTAATAKTVNNLDILTRNVTKSPFIDSFIAANFIKRKCHDKISYQIFILKRFFFGVDNGNQVVKRGGDFRRSVGAR